MRLLDNPWFPSSSIADPIPTRARDFLWLVVQAALTFSLLHFYRIEEANGLTYLLPFLGAGIVIQHWLPFRFRPLHFIVLCCMLLWVALGTLSSIVVIATLFALFVTAHSRLPRWLKYIAAGSVVVAFALVRIQYFYFPSVLTAVPVLGTLLMFRFILYCYEIKFETQPVSITERLSYFLNPVNIAFPLFPVIGYKPWITPSENRAQLYLRSTRRILLGTVQLLLYRWIYLHIPAPSLISDSGEMLLYMLGGYTLILRMLGIFWIAVGLLGYFGYSLPPIFDNAFFVTGFSDMWRRINIYWRDFMTKVFYYPIYFRLRRKTKRPLLIASVSVFAITWLLHGWQWFWIRGDFNFKLTDVLYWVFLGGFITLNLLRDEKRNRTPEDYSWKGAWIYALRIVGMYSILSFLWMLWQSATVGEFLYLLSKISVQPQRMMPVIAVMAGILLAAAVMRYALAKRKDVLVIPDQLTIPATALVTVFLLAPFFITTPAYTGSGIAALHRDIKTFRQNVTDRENAEQGYYEHLIDAHEGAPWEQQAKVHGRNQWFSAVEQPVNDLRKRVMRPSMKIEHDGLTFTTNRWGMRGPEYPLSKPDGVIRIAVLGSSYEMGSGVDDADVFIRKVEQLINDSLRKSGQTTRAEFLNFSTGAYHAPQYAYLCDSVIFPFSPDAVFCFSHSNELQRLNATFAGLIKNGTDLHYDTLRTMKTSAGAEQSMSRTEIKSRLQQMNIPLLKWSYRHITSVCRAQNVPAFWVYLPTVSSELPVSDYPLLSGFARWAGFHCISLEGVYGDTDQSKLQVAEEDYHANAQGHALIARKLYHELTHDAAFNNLLSGTGRIP